MTRRSNGFLTAAAVLAALVGVVALTAQAGTAAQRTAPPTASLHAADGAGVHGAITFSPTRDGEGTSVALTLHGLPARAQVDARLHAGRSLERLSRSSTPLASGRASTAGSFRTGGRLQSRGHDVRSSAVTDGAHTVVVRAAGRSVAYAHIPRG